MYKYFCKRCESFFTKNEMFIINCYRVIEHRDTKFKVDNDNGQIIIDDKSEKNVIAEGVCNICVLETEKSVIRDFANRIKGEL